MNRLEILPIEYGKSVLAENYIFKDGAEDKIRPIVFMVYVIKTQSKLILVDAGCVTMPWFDMYDFIGAINALEKSGIKPQDITDLIITHAHHDHIECVSEFEHARIYIQQDEYESGKKYFKPGMNITTFDDEMQICPGVKAVKIGGHSKGSCIVEITDGQKKYIIAGDECYLQECIEKKIPTGSSCSPDKSRRFIEKYAGKEYTVLLCHDK